MEDILLYFSITCIGLLCLGYLIQLIEYIFIDTPEEKKQVKPDEKIILVDIFTDFVSTA
jgi:hypothetical protein